MDESQERGFFDPTLSRINFAVPSMSSLRSSSKVLPVKEITPGILHPIVQIVKDAAMLTPSAFKLCVDGERI